MGNTIDSENEDEECAMPYVLPSWRMNEIVFEVLTIFVEVEYSSQSFDIMNFIKNKGIKLAGYSTFETESLEALKSISYSYWKEGLFSCFPDPKTKIQCRIIAYDDSKTGEQKLLIILHELGHFVLGHTEQCEQGEIEATCFAIAMMGLIRMNEQLKIGQLLRQSKSKETALESLKQNLFNDMEVETKNENDVRKKSSC